jgi:hypothetical protein
MLSGVTGALTLPLAVVQPVARPPRPARWVADRFFIKVFH